MKKILITTGGSGGHVIPALSIYDSLKDKFKVEIATDLRGSKYIDNDKYDCSLIDVPNLFSNLILLPLNLLKFCDKKNSLLRKHFLINKKINLLVTK